MAVDNDNLAGFLIGYKNCFAELEEREKDTDSSIVIPQRNSVAREAGIGGTAYHLILFLRNCLASS